MQLLYALNTQTGHVVASRVLHLDRKDNGPSRALKASPNGQWLVPLQSSTVVVVLSLPSLTEAGRFSFRMSHEGAAGYADWVGWTSLSQLIIVSRTAHALLVSVHSPCDGALLASHRVASGCFERLGSNNVAASPHHPYLAMTFRYDPQTALSRLTPGMREALFGPLQGAEQAQARREALLQADIKFWTLVLDLGSRNRSVYPVAHGRCFYPAEWWLHLAWAPDGLTVACEKRRGHCTDLSFWHGPSASVIGSYERCGIYDVVWSPDGKFCALTSGCSIRAMLHLDSANGSGAVGEMCLESYRASLPRMHNFEHRECFSFSPCSRRFLYWGKLSGRPAASVRMLQWSIDPVQGIVPPEEVMDRFCCEELQQIGCTWLSSPSAACLYVVMLRSGLVHFMSGLHSPQASPYATLNVKEAWPGDHESPRFHFAVSHDGLTLCCHNVRDDHFAFFRLDQKLVDTLS